jgi:hypothetical protein
MPKYSIKKEESKEVKKVTFNKENDYKTIKMKASGNVVLVHHVQADVLIKKGQATLEKNVEVEESIPTRTVKPVKNAPTKTV